MEDENDNRASSEASSTTGSVSFSQVTAVATEWMFDFLFVSLCRHFKEGNLDEFNDHISTLQALSQSPTLKGSLYKEKTMICAFLARVMHGQQLDVLFEEDDSMMPLMSAAKIWSNLECTVSDESLFKNITVLLLVQSVAVCMKEGQRSSASSALKWFENNQACPQNVQVRLSTIVAQKEIYHPFLMSFSFSRLLETIQSFLDAYLEKNPSDYLLKAATRMVQSSQSIESLEDEVSQDSSLSESTNKSPEKNKRTKRKLLPTKMTDVWKPNTSKKLTVSVRRITKNELLEKIVDKSQGTSNLNKKRKPREKWTPQLDKYLKDGVRRHGMGKWGRILLDYDFEGRTGTMLKDRWRTLMRANKVS